MQGPLGAAFATIALMTTAAVVTAGPLHDAVKSGDVAQAGGLLDGGSDPDEQDEFGTSLHIAAVRGNEAMATLLLQRGADPNAARTDDGFTPLHIAAEWGRLGVARLLLAHGADVNALGIRRGAGIPPLHLAELEGRAEVGLLLREAGAAPPPVEPVAPLMASADPERGRLAAMRCDACHTLFDRERHGTMITLRGVVDRVPASEAGADYSPALRRLGGIWSEEALNQFLAYPAATVPGTTMQFDGVMDPQERADLILYLRSVGDGGAPMSP